MTEFLTRRGVRHALVRARNTRVLQDRDDRWPVLLVMHPLTMAELLMDSDPAERHVIDFEGKAFMDIPVLEDPGMAVGEVAMRWPQDPAPAPSPDEASSPRARALEDRS